MCVYINSINNNVIFTWMLLSNGILFDAGNFFSKSWEFSILWNMLTSSSSENIIVKYLSSKQWLSLLEKQLKNVKNNTYDFYILELELQE